MADAGARDESALLLDALIASVGLDAVRSVVDPDVPFTVEEVVAAGLIAPELAPLFGHLLDLLRRFAVASEDDRRWRITLTHDLPEIGEVWRLLLAEAPDWSPSWR